MSKPKPKVENPFRISLKKWRQHNGYEDEDSYMEYLGELVCDSICPALCTEGCEVEPDGVCSHGCSSLLIVAGII